MTRRVVGAVVGLVLVVAVALFAFRGSRPPEPEPSFKPAPPSADASPLGAGAPSDKPGADPPLTDLEMRESHLSLSHEQCEDGARRISTLDGRDGGGQGEHGAMRTVSLCLRYGNVAWYKCILRATSSDEGHACTRRLMNGALVP